MSDVKKAFLTALTVVLLFNIWLANELPFLKESWRSIVHSPVTPFSTWKNLEAFGLLLLIFFLNVFMLSLLAFRRLGLRQAGDMLAHQHKEIRSGVSVLNRVRGRG